MKKFSCILLICVILIQLVPMGAWAAEDRETRKLDTLIGLNILANYSVDSFNEDSYVSSGAFVNAVLNLIQNQETFSNISTEHSVDMAKNLKILDGITDFQKQRTILCSQALDVLVRALGYKLFIENGKSAIDAAAQMGISVDGIGEDKPLTYGVMINILYDALKVHPLVFDRDTYTFDTSTTILKKFKKIRRIEGLVSENSYTGLTTEDVSGQSHLVIGGVMCFTDTVINDDLLGMYVEAYVKETDDGDSLIYARPWKNETFTLDREDITSIDDSYRILSYELGEDLEELEISPTVKVIYNGIVYGEYEKTDFVADNGQITFIDNDCNGVYDVVKITAYRTMVVKSISAFDGVIINKYTYDAQNKSITLNLDNEEYVIVKDGKITSIKDIIGGDVLQISEPKSGLSGKTIIYASSATAEGELTGVLNSENIVTMGENEYTLSDAYVMASNDLCYTELKPGNYYKLYLDTFGKVVFAEEKKFNVTSYGYMNKVFCDEHDDRYYIQLFSTDGEWYKYPLKDYVSYNNVRMSASVIFKGFTDENGNIKQPQMIRYRVNKNNEINVLDTAQTADGYEKDTFTKISVSEKYRYENMSFLSKEIFLGNDTVVMMIPEDETDKRSYAAKDQSWIARDEVVNCTVYDLDEWNKTPIITIVDNSDNKAKTLKNKDLCVVESVSQVLDSDGVVSQQVVMHQPFYGKISLLSDDQNNFTGVRPGDIIQFDTDIHSRVTATQILYSLSEGEKLVWKTSSDFYYATTMLAGKVIDVDAQRRMLKMDCGETHFLSLAPVDYYRDIDVVIFDRRKNSIETGSIQDIRPGDYVVADMSWYLISNLVIYR